MFFLSFFHGNLLAGIFSSDASVITAAADYLKAYAIDCMLTAIFFCYTGFYNGTVTFSYRTCNTNVICFAVDFMPWIYVLSKENGIPKIEFCGILNKRSKIIERGYHYETNIITGN